jgi:hypothetical protein
MYHFDDAKGLIDEMRFDIETAVSMGGIGEVHNFMGQIVNMTMENATYETDLFPKEVLEAYTDYNLGMPMTDEQMAVMSPERGGPQGDYRKSMPSKIEKVVLALRSKPKSKRAVLTIPFTDKCALCVKTDEDAEWKCLRELYFHIDDVGHLCCTGVMRAQALSIAPKNLHLIAAVMANVAINLGIPVGSYTHHCIILVNDRS